MPPPRIVILGVYKPEIPKSVFLEQLKSTGSVEKTEAHFRDLVLVEALVEQGDDGFKMSELGQSYERGDYAVHFQCAYDEALLTPDGKAVVERVMNCVQGLGLLRCAFYLHFYDANRPLRWSYGQIHCPPVEPVPSRLKNLLPYRAL